MIWKGDDYWTHTGKLYDELSDEYGFDRSKRNNFGHQGALLYANEVSPEGFSVWCLTNTNWYRRPKNKNGKECNWYNFITRFRDNFCPEITEYWNKELWVKNDKRSINLRDELYWRDDTRLVFVKMKDGKYCFLGIYKFTERDEQEKTKRYVLISDSYPILVVF